MSGETIFKRAYHFSGMSLLVPEQSVPIVPFELPIPDGILPITEEFRLIRFITNIALFSLEHFEAKYFERPIQEFHPPLEVRVAYREQDLIELDGQITQLKLAYWDMTRWVIISNPEHEYQILPSSTAMVAEAKIWSWLGDPTLAWGK